MGMSDDKRMGSVSLWWAVGTVAVVAAVSLVAQAMGQALTGGALGGLLAALGLRLAVMADAVQRPAAPAPGPHPERLHPAHI